VTPSQKLLTRLRGLGLAIPEGSTLGRTYAGSNQRTAGAWSWYLLGPDTAPGIVNGTGLGSQWSVAALLKARLLVTQDCTLGRGGNDITVAPWEESTARERARFHLWIEEPPTQV